MPRICRANIDKAGGIILGGSSTVFVDGYPVALEGNSIQIHEPKDQRQHQIAKVINGNPKVIVDGIPVCMEGYSKGTCGHIATSGSSVDIG